MPFFDLRIRQAESSDKIWRLGPADSEIRFCNHIGLHKKTDLFFRSKSTNLKVGIGSHKKQTYFDVKIWPYRVDVVPNLPKCPVPTSMLYRYRYQLRYKRPYRYRGYRYWCRTELTKVSGNGIDVVPNLSKCPVPVIPAVYTGGMPRYIPYRTHPCKFQAQHSHWML